jgi:transposase-like protein
VSADLDRVRRAAARRARSERDWQDAIREAVAAGGSLRQVAKAAGVSHVRVLQLARRD